jgi:hypothetical protein
MTVQWWLASFRLLLPQGLCNKLIRWDEGRLGTGLHQEILHANNITSVVTEFVADQIRAMLTPLHTGYQFIVCKLLLIFLCSALWMMNISLLIDTIRL